jgi:hypothetical protein
MGARFRPHDERVRRSARRADAVGLYRSVSAGQIDEPEVDSWASGATVFKRIQIHAAEPTRSIGVHGYQPASLRRGTARKGPGRQGFQ